MKKAQVLTADEASKTSRVGFAGNLLDSHKFRGWGVGVGSAAVTFISAATWVVSWLILGC